MGPGRHFSASYGLESRLTERGAAHAGCGRCVCAAELSRDEAALRRLVDERFVFNTCRGTTTGKEEPIRGVLKMHMVGQTIRERSVLIEGDVALDFGTAELRFAGPGKPESVSTLRYTSTFVNRQGQSRMLALRMQ